MMTDNFLNTQGRRTEKSMTCTIRVLFKNEGEDGKGRKMVTLSAYIHTHIGGSGPRPHLTEPWMDNPKIGPLIKTLLH